MRIGTLADHDATKELNKVLKTCSQMNWIGTVSDLLNGDHPYALKVREAFCSDTGSIQEDEKEDFFEFLDTWGI